MVLKEVLVLFIVYTKHMNVFVLKQNEQANLHERRYEQNIHDGCH